MTLFPLLAAVTILFDGRPMRGYVSVFEADGHVFAPVRPYVTRVADRLWYAGDYLAIERDGRVVYIRLSAARPDELYRVFIPLRSVMRALGIEVGYNKDNRAVDIRLPSRAIVALPTPFNSALPESSPSIVFTPEPGATPRPMWEGPALPRRTPLPYESPAASH